MKVFLLHNSPFALCNEMSWEVKITRYYFILLLSLDVRLMSINSFAQHLSYIEYREMLLTDGHMHHSKGRTYEGTSKLVCEDVGLVEDGL